MTRRQLIQSLGYLSTHAMFSTVLTEFISGCTNAEKKTFEFFTAAEMDTVIETIDIILPATKSKSASEVNTQFFLDQVFAKCMTPEQQAVIKKGLADLASGLLSAPDKLQYITEIDSQAYAGREEAAYFKIIKQYAIIGFFTSQEGTTRASNYVKIPEAFKGEITATAETLNYGKTNLKF